MRLVFVEPTLQHLLLCLRFINEHEVILIDSYPEVGTPSFQVGWCSTPEVFEEYLTEQEIMFLQLSKSREGYGFRIDWLVKHLIRKCVMHGVQVFSRTTILESETIGPTTKLRIQSPANLPDIIDVDVVHVDSSIKRFTPGHIEHAVPNNAITGHLQTQIVQWNGILMPTKYVDHNINGIILNRSDGCSEVWSKDSILTSAYTMEQWTLHLGEDLASSKFDAILDQSNESYALVQDEIQRRTR